MGPASRHLLRSQDPTVSLAQHPLLQSWGRDAREMQLVLGAAVPHGGDRDRVDPAGPAHAVATDSGRRARRSQTGGERGR